MSAKADNSGQTDSPWGFPVVAYFEGDIAVRTALDGSRKFNWVPWGDSALWSTPPQVLLVASEHTLAECWNALPRSGVRIIALSDTCFTNPQLDAAVFAYLPLATSPPLVERMIDNAIRDIHRGDLHHEVTERLRVAYAEIDDLDAIGMALSAEHEIPRLLDMILTKARQITAADAGSIYLVAGAQDTPSSTAKPHLVASDSLRGISGVLHGNEIARRGAGATPPLVLRFVWAQNDTVSPPLGEMVVEINEASIAGHVAMTGECVHLDDAYNPPPGLPYRINRSFDAKLGYRTKSILTVPMRNEKDEVVGVLQLMNSRRDPAAKLTSPSDVAAHVVPFTVHHRELIMSLASQAAVALQNSRLLASIENLFEGFVRASVVAIEQRDPTTYGHSFRVAQLTLALAEAVNRTTSGPLAHIQFTPNQMKELRYAALLHDFGKVGVREDVLLKATKLRPLQLESLRQRFLFAKRTAEVELLREQLQFLLNHGEFAYRQKEQQAETGLREYWAQLNSLWDCIQRSNLPTVTPETVCTELAEAAGWTYSDLDGKPQPLVTDEEALLLSIPKGSLDPDERAQMEAHVIYTVHFLRQIPWTEEVRGVIAIAAGHHEKLNGSGYPYQLSAPEISVQTRMITIVDIFDGLTASDRPYKKAASPKVALDILRAEADEGAIDPVLFELFSDLVHQGVAHTGELQEQSSTLADKPAVSSADSVLPDAHAG
jgi:HD-GYP domain-containing protein (c-di-GMP phosphodiesterase class II)